MLSVNSGHRIELSMRILKCVWLRVRLGKSLEDLGAGVWWYRLVISHDKNVLLETAQISLKV